MYRDPNEIKRAVSHISWYPDGAHRLAAAYSSLGFQKGSTGVPLESYIWELGKNYYNVHVLVSVCVAFIAAKNLCE